MTPRAKAQALGVLLDDLIGLATDEGRETARVLAQLAADLMERTFIDAQDVARDEGRREGFALGLSAERATADLWRLLRAAELKAAGMDAETLGAPTITH